MIFTNQKEPMHFSYQRFLENQLREKWDFPGAPIRFLQRLRKRERDSRVADSDDEAPRRPKREHETLDFDE